MVEPIRSSFESEMSRLEDLYNEHFLCDYTRNSYHGQKNCPFIEATISAIKTFHRFGMTKADRTGPHNVDNLQRYLSLTPKQRERAKELGRNYMNALQSVDCKKCIELDWIERQLVEYIRASCWPDDSEQEEVKLSIVHVEDDPEMVQILGAK